MKNLIAKYLIELIVIITGISLSFYVDELGKYNNNEKLKNQSLKRILQNLEGDIKDNRWNYKAVSRSIESGDWIFKNRKRLNNYSRDTIGFHLTRANNFLTIFVDNQEEYSTLKSSGYIELIKNESIVKSLQNKYVGHSWMKELEKFIIRISNTPIEYEHKNSEFINDSLNDLGFPIGKRYVGDLNFPREIIGRIKEKLFWQNAYLRQIKSRLKKDSLLIVEIENEVSL